MWRRIDDDTVIKYRCLQVLPEGGYCVKISHLYRYPLHSIDDEQIKQAEFYFLDGLFQDGMTKLTMKTYSTLEKAIKKHDKDFAYSFEQTKSS